MTLERLDTYISTLEHGDESKFNICRYIISRLEFLDIYISTLEHGDESKETSFLIAMLQRGNAYIGTLASILGFLQEFTNIHKPGNYNG